MSCSLSTELTLQKGEQKDQTKPNQIELTTPKGRPPTNCGKAGFLAEWTVSDFGGSSKGDPQNGIRFWVSFPCHEGSLNLELVDCGSQANKHRLAVALGCRSGLRASASDLRSFWSGKLFVSKSPRVEGLVLPRWFPHANWSCWTTRPLYDYMKGISPQL